MLSIVALAYQHLSAAKLGASGTPEERRRQLFDDYIAAMFLALRNGGFAVLQHYTLRLLLYRNGSCPLRLVPFLDYCAERIFLRKVGGGYIFVHRLLMEQFASLSAEPAEQPPPA